MVRYLSLFNGALKPRFLYRGVKLNKYSFLQKRMFITSIGRVCGDFRKKRLKITLREMEHETGVPTTTLNSFEQGRSSSLNVFYIYLVSCETQKQATEFLQYIVEVCLFNWKDNNHG